MEPLEGEGEHRVEGKEEEREREEDWGRGRGRGRGRGPRWHPYGESLLSSINVHYVESLIIVQDQRSTYTTSNI